MSFRPALPVNDARADAAPSEPFASSAGDRTKRRLGDAFGHDGDRFVLADKRGRPLG